MNGIVCCECKQPAGRRSILMCADCRGWFHYPDSRVGEDGLPCGVHVVGMRQLLGHDVVPLCRRCDMAFRLQFGIPS